nr:hypothetical protein [Actinomadura madurae]
MQICPALAKQPTAACSPAQTGSTPGVDDQRVGAAVLQQGPRAGPRGQLGDAPGRRGWSRRARRRPRPGGGERLPDPGAAGHQVEDAVRQASGEQLGEQGAGVGRPLGRLVHDRVARRHRRADQPAGDGDRVVPRRDDGRDAERFADREVGGVPAALQAAPAVQRSQLGVLAQRPDPGLDAAERVTGRLAHLRGDQRGQLAHALLDRSRGGVQGRAPLGGGNGGPARRRVAGRGHGGLRVGRGGHGHHAQRLAGRRVGHREHLVPAALAPPAAGQRPPVTRSHCAPLQTPVAVSPTPGRGVQ